jgi:hypothetical protein
MQLHQILLDICANVYFQPPASVDIKYPCIIYNRDKIDAKHADDETYSQKTRYKITTIDSNPDSLMPFKVIIMPFCKHETAFAHDGLNHDVFSLYY